MNKESLKAVIQQFTEQPLPEILHRETDIPATSGKVVTLIGARRTGKTFMLFKTMDEIVQSGVERNRILYLNFEDDRLYPVEADQLDLILKAHRELYPDTAESKRYLFFDELQNVPEWERYVRRLHDTENVSIFLTGSSSSLLQKDMSTAMRGRSITYEVFPLSFSEFLTFKQIDYIPYSPDSEARVINAFHEYLEWGGFPEVVLAEEPLKMMILQEYASLMLHRDLIEHYNIRNERLMHLLLKFCAEHTASLVSVNKLFNDFASQGMKIGKTSLYDYMSMLEDSFIAFRCPKFDPSTRRQLQSPNKIHLLDTGLCRVFRPFPKRDIGHRFETLVYLHERRKQRDIHHYRNGFELDLCWNEGAEFINVAWDMNTPETLNRELKAFDAGRARWPNGRGRLVYGSASHIPEAHKKEAIEGWRYLLNLPNTTDI